MQPANPSRQPPPPPPPLGSDQGTKPSCQQAGTTQPAQTLQTRPLPDVACSPTFCFDTVGTFGRSN
ncbi:hypothetical protein AOQ84DRAFT_356281 [Glonium stellatum]|uniref:Uncharacterized protein n=1 Tax=Glonium stellatum TaxID=574774 RepID=A0A8E2JPL2_9PEZI|nr:hypothetical protein AOQ84DRAFT_356281 [Glonium stellatum]